MNISRRHFFPFIWLAFIIYASLFPANDLPKFVFFPNFDKIVHFGIYFVLAVLLIPFILKNENYFKSYLISVISAILTGILFEILQLCIGHGRSASPYDALANSIGAICGIIFYRYFIKEKRIERFIFKIG